jgi:hypothetical protein
VHRPVASGTRADRQRIARCGDLDLGAADRLTRVVPHGDVQHVLGQELEVDRARARVDHDLGRPPRASRRIRDDPGLPVREPRESRPAGRVAVARVGEVRATVHERQGADVRARKRRPARAVAHRDVERAVAARHDGRQRRRDEVVHHRTERRARNAPEREDDRQRGRDRAEAADVRVGVDHGR